MRVALDDIAESVGYGVTASACDKAVGPKFLRITDIQDGSVDWYAVPWCECDKKKLEAARLQRGDIVFARTGATTGKSFLIDDCPDEAVFASYLIRVRLGETADPEFVSRFFQTADYWNQITKSARGVAQPGVNATKLKALQVPLPPLAEQKRIAGILDAADALRAKRRASLAQLDTLLQSTFLDLFGDPVTNPMRWKVGRLADVVERLDGGKNIAQSETEADYRVLKVSAVTSGVYRPDESKYLPAEFDVPASYIVKPGDLLISRANTVELIGATAYVWETPENIALPDKIWKFIWKRDAEIEPLFIYHLSQDAEFRRILGSRASGTSGSMKNITKPKLLGLPIPRPPLDVQRRFTAIVESVERQKARLRTHLAELDALFASLQSRAFNGEL